MIEISENNLVPFVVEIAAGLDPLSGVGASLRDAAPNEVDN